MGEASRKGKAKYGTIIRSMRSIVVSTSLLSDIESTVSKHLHGVEYNIKNAYRLNSANHNIL